MTLLSQNWGSIKPILPVASGGLSPLHIPNLIELLGTDIVFQFGGGCHGHPDGTFNGAKAIRQAMDAVLNGISLAEYAETHIQLKKALKIWK
jgi:ribulose-bisphosphate carboxylase large chain